MRIEGDKYMSMIESWKRLRATTEDCTISLSELLNRSYTIGFDSFNNSVRICSDKEIKQLTKRYMGTKINENIRRNAEMDDFWKEILEERDRLAERCKYLENACKFSYRAFSRFTRMPDITDYTYDSDTATTTITWSDNTTTTVTAEDPATADQYAGFMIAYAKKAAGNTSRIQSIYERALKLPEKKALAEQKAKEKEEEQKKIRENQKARKRRQRVRREARRRKEEYEKSLIREEAKRLAEKEYGVPYEQSDWLKQSGDDANGKTET